MAMDISGTVVNQSSIFNLSKGNSIYLVRVKLQDQKDSVFILIPLKKRKYEIFTNFSVEITNLREVELFKGSASSTKVYQLSNKSTVNKSESLSVSSHLDDTYHTGLISFKGIVTSIYDEENSIYILDKKIYLVLSLVPQCPGLCLGDRVSVRLAHLKTFKGMKCLVLCGLGNVETCDPIKSPEVNRILSRFRNIVLKHKLCWEDVERVYKNTKIFSALPKNSVDLKLVDKLTGLHGDDLTVRSQVKEFLHHNESCDLDSTASRIRSCFTVNEILSDENLRENVNEEGGVLIGNINHVDNDTFVAFNTERMLLLNSDGACVLKQDDLVAITEWEIINSDEKKVSVVISKNLHRLNLNSNELVQFEPVECKTKFRIVNKSSVLNFKGLTFFLIEIVSEFIGRQLVRLDDVDSYSEMKVSSHIVCDEQEPFKIWSDVFNTEFMMEIREVFNFNHVFFLSQGILQRERCLISSTDSNPTELQWLDEAHEIPISDLNSVTDGECVSVSGVITNVEMEENETLVIEICSEMHSIKIFINTDFVHPPGGLCEGTCWRFTNLIKRTSRKKNSYLLSSIMIRFHFLNYNCDISSDRGSKLCNIQDLLDGRVEVGDIIFCVDELINLYLELTCSSCANQFYNGRCSYVGCQAPPDYQVAGSCCVLISDMSYLANMVINSFKDITTLLNLSCKEELELKSALCKTGTFSFSRWNKDASAVTDKVRKFLFKIQNHYLMFKASVRRYKKSGSEEVKLFCLNITNDFQAINQSLES